MARETEYGESIVSHVTWSHFVAASTEMRPKLPGLLEEYSAQIRTRNKKLVAEIERQFH